MKAACGCELSAAAWQGWILKGDTETMDNSSHLDEYAHHLKAESHKKFWFCSTKFSKKRNMKSLIISILKYKHHEIIL